MTLADAADDRRERYNVHEGGQRVGRIRFAKERTPGKWIWQVQVHIAGPPFGDAKIIDEAKERFRAAWLAVKANHTAEELAAAYDEMNPADRPHRYPRQ